uniref:Mitochondrial import inner membrane translocase subunit n=1 Tax=Acrobeloides nanus TaxID=290746 RepID=A0A914DHG6_9BILA
MEQVLNMDELKRLSQNQRNQMISGLKQQESMVSSSDRDVKLIAYLQTSIMEAADRCLQGCISKPGARLTKDEKNCLERCMNPYNKSCELLQRLQSDYFNEFQEY